MLPVTRDVRGNTLSMAVAGCPITVASTSSYFYHHPLAAIILIMPYDRSLSPVAHSLPTEVLAQIFRLVFDMNTFEDYVDILDILTAMTDPNKDSERQTPVKRMRSEIQETDTDMMHLSLFPYCISYVCSAWNEICLSIPEFWTRIFVDIGPNAGSILRLRRELKASRDKEVSVYVSRRDGFTNIDPLEHRRMNAFMKVLSPHVGRCSMVHIETRHQLSLLPVVQYLSGDTSTLVELQAYSHDREVIPPQDQIITKNLSAPNIEVIEMDAILFQCSLSSRWIVSCLPDTLQVLTILDMTYSNPTHGVELHLSDVFKVLNSLSLLRKLSLSGVRFSPNELSDAPEVLELTSSISHVFLQNLQPHAAAAILRIFQDTTRPLDVLHINNCPISDVYDAPYVCDLVLEAEDAAEDILSLMDAADPDTLFVDNCPSFTSELLDCMHPDPELSSWPCQSMTTLTIGGEGVSERVSISSIKDFVRNRFLAAKQHAERYPWLFENGLEGHGIIGSLVLKDFSNISDADLSYLHGIVPRFRLIGHTCE
jgi:hypothetical protein